MKDEVQGTAITAINFAIEKIDDHYERLDFLTAWREGRADEEWPEFAEYRIPTPIADSSEGDWYGFAHDPADQRKRDEAASSADSSEAGRGDNLHDAVCSADHRKPLGTPGCSCVARRAALSDPIGGPVACINCGRALGEHSLETADLCNLYLPPSEPKYRCAICGFVIDSRYEATKPTIEFGMAGRAKAIHPPAPAVGAEDVARLLEEARDMLMERIYGNPARSPGHNARLKIERAISLLSGQDGGK